MQQAVPWARAIMHLDMDAFFVNVHILDHPEDADIPLAVGGRPDSRGVVASASYAARRFGVRSAMPTSHALRLCPQLKIVPANWPRIRDCSRQVMAILAGYGPVEKMSVDEAYVDLSAHADPVMLAQTIRAAVKTDTGLPCSVGLATSKLVAKVASDHEKPAGFTVVPPGQEAAFLAPLPTRVILGIGPRTAERLAALGITTCGELATADPTPLQTAFGRHAADLQRLALGHDDRPVEAERGPAKSISQENTFSRDVNDPTFLRDQLRRMAARVADGLQSRGLVAHTVTVKFRWADFTTFTRQKSVEAAVDQPAEIYRLALAIWEAHWPPGQRMRLLGVGVSNLEEPSGRQMRLEFS
jgi:DNA polymerase IV